MMMASLLFVLCIGLNVTQTHSYTVEVNSVVSLLQSVDLNNEERLIYEYENLVANK